MWVFEFRDQLTKDDIKVYAAVVEKPGDTFPNAAKWYDAVSSQLAPRFVPLSLLFLFFFSAANHSFVFLYLNCKL